MGNFYANLAMRGVDPDRVASVLESHERTAFIATVGDSAFIYDERCDAQDLSESRTLARIVARELGISVLAVSNHDDDVLWIALADQRGAVDVYDSYPGYFDGGSDQPKLSSLSRLSAAFGAPRAELEKLLRTPHGAIGLEVERHRRLMSILTVNPDAAVFGYRYAPRASSRSPFHLFRCGTLEARLNPPRLKARSMCPSFPPRPCWPAHLSPA